VHIDFWKKILIVEKLAFLAYFGSFLQNANFSIPLTLYATYMQKQPIRGTTMQVDFTHATSDSAEH